MQTRTVLVADDNAAIRQLLQVVLSRAGYDVLLACDGIEASLLIERRPFHTVITDLDMPRRSGLEVIADVRRVQPDARIIAMSGDWIIGGVDVREMAAVLGVRSFLTKPFSMRALAEMVSSDDGAVLACA